MKSIKVIAFDRWGGGSPVENTYAVSFDGVDDYADNTSMPHATLGGTFSFAFWIKPISGAFGYRYISCRSGGTNPYFEATRGTDGKIKFFLNGTTGTGQKTTTGGSFPDNEWHHCVITWNGSTLKIYADGVLDKTDSNYSGNLMGEILECGGLAGGVGYNTEVILDELAFWDKKLNATEVSEVYGEAIIQDLSALSTSSNLVHWWRMGDGDTFPTLQDSVGGNDFTMYNMTSSDITTDSP